MSDDRPEPLTRDDVVDFAHHVAGLADAGLALPSGLRALGQEMPGGALRRSLLRVAGRLERGEALDDVLDEPGGRFPEHLRGLVRAGLRTGRLGEVLGRYTDFERVGSELRRKVWMNLAYPIMLLTAMATVLVFVSWIVVKDIETIYQDFGISLPWLTRVLIRVSRAVVSAGWGIVLAPLAVAATVWFLGRSLPNAPWRRRVACGIPLIGPLWRWSALAEFSHLLALLLESDVALPEALPMAADGVRDADLSAVSRRMARDVEEGASLADSAAGRRVYPTGFARILAWAQANQALPEALHMAGDTFEARARAQAAFLGIFFTVVAVVLVIFGVILVVFGLYWPLYQLIRGLSL